MKVIKIYVVVASILLSIALGLGVYVWYVFQEYTARIETGESIPREEIVVPVTTKAMDVDTVVHATQTSEKAEKAATVISIDQLTDTQRSVLSAFGIQGESFVVTERMIACATEAVGDTRFTEIINGAAPSPFEMMQLLPCMKK